MHLTLVDAILLGVIAIVAPAYSYYAGRRIQRGAQPERVPAYVRSMASWWLLAGVTAFAWVRLGRPLDALGLTIPFEARAVAGILPCVMLLAYIWGQRRVVARLTPEKIARVRTAFGRTTAILPTTPVELRWFLGLALTAGICEELLYRGYFVAVTSPALTIWGAVAASAALFGIAHAYQGIGGVLRTALVGLVLGAIYVATGSLVWAMLVHALVDVRGGLLGYAIVRVSARSSGTS